MAPETFSGRATRIGHFLIFFIDHKLFYDLWCSRLSEPEREHAAGLLLGEIQN